MPNPRRRLVVNADDFGRSASINQAVIRAHSEGILTTASLMVNEPACAEAVELAHRHPTLGVGLHLTFLCGRSALSCDRIPGLVSADGEFTNNPTGAGFRYFFHRDLREQLRMEMRAQFQRFRATGLPLDHVNGHLHLHLHPTLFRLLMEEAAHLGVDRVRLTVDPLRLNLRLASGRLGYRLVHALVFQRLAAQARPVLQQRGFRHTQTVFGLLQNGRVDERYVLALLPSLPNGDSELYSHPSLDEFRNEFDALVSRQVRAKIRELGIELIRYRDL
jgi:chitin disaccharide deacetylase